MLAAVCLERGSGMSNDAKTPLASPLSISVLLL